MQEFGRRRLSLFQGTVLILLAERLKETEKFQSR
jgi:hypothetical protein